MTAHWHYLTLVERTVRSRRKTNATASCCQRYPSRRPLEMTRRFAGQTLPVVQNLFRYGHIGPIRVHKRVIRFPHPPQTDGLGLSAGLTTLADDWSDKQRLLCLVFSTSCPTLEPSVRTVYTTQQNMLNRSFFELSTTFSGS